MVLFLDYDEEKEIREEVKHEEEKESLSDSLLDEMSNQLSIEMAEFVLSEPISKKVPVNPYFGHLVEHPKSAFELCEEVMLNSVS